MIREVTREEFRLVFENGGPRWFERTSHLMPEGERVTWTELGPSYAGKKRERLPLTNAHEEHLIRSLNEMYAGLLREQPADRRWTPEHIEDLRKLVTLSAAAREASYRTYPEYAEEGQATITPEEAQEQGGADVGYGAYLLDQYGACKAAASEIGLPRLLAYPVYLAFHWYNDLLMWASGADPDEGEAEEDSKEEAPVCQ